MSSTTDLLRTATTFEALALVGENARFVKKKKKRTKDFLQLGATNIVGSALIKAQSDFI